MLDAAVLLGSASGLGRVADPGAAYQHRFLAMRRAGLGEAGIDARLVRYVHFAEGAADLGRDYGATITDAELDYLMRAEWAQRGEDVLWRRSKLGLRLSAEQAAEIDRAMQTRRAGIRAEAV